MDQTQSSPAVLCLSSFHKGKFIPNFGWNRVQTNNGCLHFLQLMKTNVRRAAHAAATVNNHDVEMSGQDGATDSKIDSDIGRLFGGSGRNTHKPHPAELVDQASRGLFPLGFMICNVVYWLYYLYFTDQDLAAMQMQDANV